MSLLDAHIPQLASSEAEFGAKVALFRSTVSEAESAAVASQSINSGEAAAAFQAAHARFVEAATKTNLLLDKAQMNLGEAHSTYVATDNAAASSYGVGF